MGWIQKNGGVASIEHRPLANHSDPNITGCRCGPFFSARPWGGRREAAPPGNSGVRERGRASDQQFSPCYRPAAIGRLLGRRHVTNCTTAAKHKDAYINGSTCLTNHVETNILAMLQHGPMSVSVNAGPFNGYHGGIINCSGSGIDHAVTLVAYGADAVTSEKFWCVSLRAVRHIPS